MTVQLVLAAMRVTYDTMFPPQPLTGYEKALAEQQRRKINVRGTNERPSSAPDA